nr:LOW QUALITY PROTEIN: G-protein coupled receptor 161-like [Rhipicephalus microplus]
MQQQSFPSSILVDESSGTLHFVPSVEADAAASASVGGAEGGPSTTSSSYITLEVHYTLLLIIMVSSVAVNGLVFVLFYQRPSVRMTSNKFVLNMAIVHLLQTFIVLPFVFVSIMFQEWIFGDVWCKIHGTVSVCLTMANIFSILLIAVDRNCAVNSPLHYSMTITKKRTVGLIVSTWVFAVLLSVPPLVGVSNIEYQESWAMCTITWYDTSLLTISYSCVLCVVGFLLPFVRITWIYASMFRAARRNSARARLHNINTSSSEMSPPPSAGLEAGSHPPLYVHRRAAWSKRTSSLSQASSLFGDEWKAVRTGVLVVVSFTACFLPFFSMTLVEPHARTRKTALGNLPAISMLFLFCSSLINPYLYVIRNKVMRKHVRKMFTCLKRKPSFFSPRGYHYSHQSPPQERKCSGEIRVPGSTASLRSGGSVDYQRPLVTHSLYQNKSGDWRIVSVTTDPRRPPSRRSSLIAQQPLCVDDMAQQQQQQFQQEQSYHQHKCGPGLRGAAIRNGFYRRASPR